jgi:outer membrane protein assembly factor BamB
MTAAVALVVAVIGLATLTSGRPSAPTSPAAPSAEPAPALETPPRSPEGDADRGQDAAVDPRAPWMVPEEGSLLHGRRFGATAGFLVFRGNPTRTFYGYGPVPRDPAIAWRYPDQRMCSIEGDLEAGGRRWCGIGWTGQVVLREGGSGVGSVELAVGGYDGAVHFVDGVTGAPSRPRFLTGAMVKGTESLDPDGFPLLYTGSRDGFLRVVALDRDVPTELWRLGRHPQGVWNNDWDANPTVLDDVLYAAGEDSWFRMVRLHRRYDVDGRVQVDPEVILEVPGFDDELFARLGDRNVSIESSPAVTHDRVYWVNSGGRVMGIDRQAALRGLLVVTLDVWVGDDADASIVVDRDGMLYVAVEQERRLPAAAELGQLIRLDPSRPEEPFDWHLAIPARVERAPGSELPQPDGGVWATPAIFGDWLYVPTHAGDLLVVDRRDGRVVHRERLGDHEWSSPAVVEEPGGPAWLVVGTCGAPSVRGYTLEDPTSPVERWRVSMPGCIEATPVVWRGTVYVGSRDGFLYALR